MTNQHQDILNEFFGIAKGQFHLDIKRQPNFPLPKKTNNFCHDVGIFMLDFFEEKPNLAFTKITGFIRIEDLENSEFCYKLDQGKEKLVGDLNLVHCASRGTVKIALCVHDTDKKPDCLELRSMAVTLVDPEGKESIEKCRRIFTDSLMNEFFCFDFETIDTELSFPLLNPLTGITEEPGAFLKKFMMGDEA